MIKKYKVHVTKVDYSITDEDICWQFDNQADLEEDSDEYYDAIHNEIERLEASLPQEMDLDIECYPDNLDDMVADAISESTGWLINGCEYQIA